MKFASLIVILVTCLGCTPASTPNTPASSASPAPAKPDPMVSIKAIIASLDRGTPHGVVAQDVRYDVKKTDSLVTPFTATITFRDAGSVPASISRTPQADSLASPIKATLAWQDDKWVVKDLSIYMFGGDEACSVTRLPPGSSMHDWLKIIGGQ